MPKIQFSDTMTSFNVALVKLVGYTLMCDEKISNAARFDAENIVNGLIESNADKDTIEIECMYFVDRFKLTGNGYQVEVYN